MALKPAKESYVKKVFGFYFAPVLWSFFTVLYLIFFLYFIVFYFGNIILALKFLFYTLALPTVSLSLAHLFWGSIFIITLLIPFSVSVYAVFIPFEIKHVAQWDRTKKVLMTIMIFVATIDVVILMDNTIRVVEKQAPISVFMEKAGVAIKP